MGVDQLLAGSTTKLVDAVRVVLTHKDGTMGSLFFINVATFGLGGNVAALVNQWRESWPRWIGGKVRFLAAPVRALEQYRNIPIEVRLDQEREIKLHSNLLVVANGRFAGGGMMLAPNAELDDGLLDIILTHRRPQRAATYSMRRSP